MVADAAAVCLIAKSRQGIKETGGKSAKAAVAQRRISFLVLDHVDIQAHFFQRFLDLLVFAKVDHVVAQGTAHQEFHGHVIDHLGILLIELLLACHPVFDDLVLHGKGNRLEQLLLVRFFNGPPEQIADIFHDLFLECFFIEYRLRSHCRGLLFCCFSHIILSFRTPQFRLTPRVTCSPLMFQSFT